MTNILVIAFSIGLGYIFNKVVGYILPWQEYAKVISYINWVVYVIIYSLNLHHFVTIVEANTAVILKNIFINDSEEPHGQRAVFGGLNLKFPFEVQYGDPILLAKTTPIKINVTKQSKAKDGSGGINIIVIGTAAVEPISNQNLVWFRRTDEKAAIALFEAKIDLETEIIIRNHTPDELVKDGKVLIQDKLQGLFDGQTVNEKEKRTGRNVSNLSISSIDKEQTSQDLDETYANMDKKVDIIERTVKAAGPHAIVQERALDAVIGDNRGKVTENINLIKGKK